MLAPPTLSSLQANLGPGDDVEMKRARDENGGASPRGSGGQPSGSGGEGEEGAAAAAPSDSDGRWMETSDGAGEERESGGELGNMVCSAGGAAGA